jgi:hydrogenase/urease accessory protein HupE
VPLIINPWGYNAFELPKAVLLRAFVILAALAVLVCVVEGRTRNIPRLLKLPEPWLLWSVLTFGLTLILATDLSINGLISVWGTYERQQGLITLDSYLALFLLSTAFIHTRERVERLWLAISLGQCSSGRLRPDSVCWTRSV